MLNLSKSNILVLLLLLAGALACGSGVIAKEQQVGPHKSPKTMTVKQRFNQQQALVSRGKALFVANQCLDCHQVAGKGCVAGLSLDGIGQLRSTKFLAAQLEDPEKHVAQVLKQFHGDTNLMPPPNLTRDEIQAVVAYLKTLTPAKQQQSHEQQN